jgi:Co/Zn/Cd efflux system component
MLKSQANDRAGAIMIKTTIRMPKMDCPSEERLVRMALDGVKEIKSLVFDLSARTITVNHSASSQILLQKLQPLKYGAVVVNDESVSEELDLDIDEIKAPSTESEARVLKILLGINFAMFVIEIVMGFVAQSTGLLADSLDMLADAAVYGISLYAVGKAATKQQKAARLSGYLQMSLALLALSEVIRRFFFGSEPLAQYMVVISALALAANVACMALISKHRTGGVHMQASWIFSTNDVIANLGVILAGILVFYFKSPIPDLVIGSVIAAVVFNGALKILRISSPAKAA